VSAARRRSLCFLHGLACAPEDWDGLIALFGKRYRCLAPNLGFFDADAGERPAPTIGALTRRATVTLQDVRGRAVLVGHSMGCRVALEMCRQRPEKVEALVLIDSGLFTDLDPAATKAAILADPARVVQDFFRQMMGPGMPAERASELVTRAKTMPAKTLAGLFQDLIFWDQQQVTPALAATHGKPMLVLQSTTRGPDGRRRMLQPDEPTAWTDLVRAQVPEARIEVLPNTGHFPMLEDPTKVAQIIMDFLESF